MQQFCNSFVIYMVGTAEHGGSFYGPNQISLWNTAERKPVNPIAKNANDCARLYNETRKILEEKIGHPVPAAS